MSEEEQLSNKKRLRAAYRPSTTLLLGQSEPAITANPLDVSKITQLKRSLDDKFRSLSDLDEVILDLTLEELIEAEILKADETKERLSASTSSPTRAAAVTRTQATRRPTADVDSGATEPPRLSPKAIVDPPAVELPPPIGGPGPILSAKVELPKNSLPRFHGHPVKWIPF